MLVAGALEECCCPERRAIMFVVGVSRVGLGLFFGCKRVVKHMALSHALSIKNKSTVSTDSRAMLFQS